MHTRQSQTRSLAPYMVPWVSSGVIAGVEPEVRLNTAGCGPKYMSVYSFSEPEDSSRVKALALQVMNQLSPWHNIFSHNIARVTPERETRAVPQHRKTWFSLPLDLQQKGMSFPLTMVVRLEAELDKLEIQTEYRMVRIC